MTGSRPLKVLFATAVDPRFGEQTIYRPLWPAYLAAHAERVHGPGRFEYLLAEPDPFSQMARERPDLVAVSSVTQNFGIAEELVAAAGRLGILSVMGGMHVTALPSALPAGASAGCIGEGEETFAELLGILLRHGSLPPARLAAVRGIVFRQGEALVVTPDRPPLPTGDIPRPLRSLLGFHKREYLVTARGCAARCSFCICARHWGPIRSLPPERVIEEVAELIDRGVKIIRFNDDDFTGDPDRLEGISRLVVERGYHRKARFSCWARATNITPRVVGLLKAMNVVAVVMGLESGSPKVLKALKGDVTVEDNRRAVALLKAVKIQASGDFIIGSPLEGIEEIEATYRFIRENPLDFVNINLFCPLPGTPAWEAAKRKGQVHEGMDWSLLRFKPGSTLARRPNYSERLTRQELTREYRRFRRLALRRNLLALLRTPWLDELPGRAFRMLRARLFGGGASRPPGGALPNTLTKGSRP